MVISLNQLKMSAPVALRRLAKFMKVDYNIASINHEQLAIIVHDAILLENNKQRILAENEVDEYMKFWANAEKEFA